MCLWEKNSLKPTLVTASIRFLLSLSKRESAPKNHSRKMNIKLKESSQFIFDSSTLGLLLSNVIVIVLAVAQKWDISTALWVYWLQSIIIGFFNFLRILS